MSSFKISEVKANAQSRFKGNYWPCVVMSLIMVVGGNAGYNAVSSGFSGGKDFAELKDVFNDFSVEQLLAVFAVVFGIVFVVSGFIYVARLFLLRPLAIGGKYFFVENTNTDGDLGCIGRGYKENYLNVVKTLFFMDIKIFLWSLLLLIPGVVKSYEYFAVPYLLAENPDMDTREIFARSKEITRGDKMKLFLLDLSFIGWYFLIPFTCCIIFPLWIAPYVYQAQAQAYNEMKSKINIA